MRQRGRVQGSAPRMLALQLLARRKPTKVVRARRKTTAACRGAHGGADAGQIGTSPDKLRLSSCTMGSSSAVRERISFVPHPKTLTAAGELEYFAARVRCATQAPALSCSPCQQLPSAYTLHRHPCTEHSHISSVSASAGPPSNGVRSGRANRQLPPGHAEAHNDRPQHPCDARPAS